MNGGFCEDEEIAGVDFGLDDVVSGAFKLANLWRDIEQEIGFMRTGNAAESTIAFADRGQGIDESGEAVAYDTVAVFVPVGAGSGAASVKATLFCAFLHEDAVIVVNPNLGAEQSG